MEHGSGAFRQNAVGLFRYAILLWGVDDGSISLNPLLLEVFIPLMAHVLSTFVVSERDDVFSGRAIAQLAFLRTAEGVNLQRDEYRTRR